jgi:hypothetical protein
LGSVALAELYICAAGDPIDQRNKPDGTPARRVREMGRLLAPLVGEAGEIEACVLTMNISKANAEALRCSPTLAEDHVQAVAYIPNLLAFATGASCRDPSGHRCMQTSCS